ncbi:LLM class F420-dependent oxidoreductase [Actinomadura kijaniata]|uniref:Putative F420-dependent oxidoreductase n=1 Tax=Actinomadura namibiensis TaxID=182080 RepID=A0A7W3QLK8_ACTNM|nr:TIGR03619 family F420-dependent LLM class oxidoreductase [Actinomadura namibiensis]MBA8951644.1 putative F420-dependent oxidoreductase [Actinomadura namibiensis]
MELGVLLPTTGPAASPEVIAATAEQAERVGLGSVWVQERLLRPPADISYGGLTPPAPAPAEWAVAYDPLETLAYVAARTARIVLGTSVVAALFHPPVVLARRIATVDRLSGGRLLVGLGQGWMPQEFEAAGVPMSRRGAGFEEHVAAMRAVWGPDPVSFRGRLHTIGESQIGPKPVLPGGPPLVVGATTERAIGRAARLGAGLTLAVSRWDDLEDAVGGLRYAAAEAGRDPSALPVVAQANGPVTDRDLGPDRLPLTGSVRQVVADLERLAKLNVDHVYWPLGEGHRADRLRPLAELRSACP